MKHLKIYETFKSHRELEKLTSDVIKGIAKKTYDTTKDLWDRNENDPQLRGVFHNLIGLSNITDYVDAEKYDELKDFINNFPLRIKPSRVDIRGSKTIKGSFTVRWAKDPMWFKAGDISLRYYNEDIQEIIKQRNEYLDNGSNWGIDQIYFKLWYVFHDTLLHELQHAYDEYRSDGKYAQDKKSKKYYGEQEIITHLKQKHQLGISLTQQEKDILNKNIDSYYKLKHEVDARFTQAIHKIRFMSVDMEDVEKNKDGVEDMIFIHKMKPFKEILRNFKIYFDGWRDMTPKTQKRLLYKLGKFYELAKDEMIEKNNEEHLRIYGVKK